MSERNYALYPSLLLLFQCNNLQSEKTSLLNLSALGVKAKRPYLFSKVPADAVQLGVERTIQTCVDFPWTRPEFTAPLGIHACTPPKKAKAQQKIVSRRSSNIPPDCCWNPFVEEESMDTALSFSFWKSDRNG